jgi:CBS domain-containing protein
MASVRDILVNKGTEVLSIGPEATVLDAALLMNDHKIGSLVVLDADRLVGLISERDLLQRVIAERRDPVETLVRDVMTTEVVCCRTYTTIEEARGVMKNRRIRHLPVVEDDSRLSGLVSIGDLNAYEAHTHEVTIHILEEYIHGRA